MTAKDFRVEVFSVLMARGWYAQAAPALVSGWALDADARMEQMAAHVQVIAPSLAELFAVQVAAPRAMIERWRLENVLLLGGGLPTPFSPAAGQVTYYTDSSAATIVEAAAAGYPAYLVDARNAEELTLVADAETAVSANLLHFLPDDHVWSLLDYMARVGFHEVAFLHPCPLARVDNPWGHLGLRAYARTREQLEMLLPMPWRLAAAVTTGALFAGTPELAGLFRHHQQSLAYLISTA